MPGPVRETSILDDLDAIKELPPEFVDRVADRKAATNGASARTNGARRQTRTVTPPPPYKEGMFVEPLTRIYGMMGVGLLLVGKQNSGRAFLENGEECAKTLDEWSKSNTKVRKMLATLTSGGQGMAVAMAHAPIALAVASDMAPNMAEKLNEWGAKLAGAMMRPHRTEDSGQSS